MAINVSVNKNIRLDFKNVTKSNTHVESLTDKVKINNTNLKSLTTNTNKAKTEVIDLVPSNEKTINKSNIATSNTAKSPINSIKENTNNVVTNKINDSTVKANPSNNINSNVNSNAKTNISNQTNNNTHVYQTNSNIQGNNNVNINVNSSSSSSNITSNINKIESTTNTNKNNYTVSSFAPNTSNISANGGSISFGSSISSTSASATNNMSSNIKNNSNSSNLNIGQGKSASVGEISRINTYISEIDVNQMIGLLQKIGIQDKDIQRIINQQITIEDLMKEIENDQDNSRRKAIMEASYLHAYGLNIESLSQLLEVIKANQTELQKLINMRDLKDTHEMEALLKIVTRLRSGENLESILSSEIVAWKYQDENGQTRYVYKTPNLESDIKYVPLTFEEMYKDSKYIEKLRNLTKVTSKSLFTGKETTVYMWNNTIEQMKFFDELTNKYNEEVKTREENLKKIDNQIETLKQSLANYQAIYENVNKEINHYFKNIDSYISEKDYEKNNNFKKESIKTIENINKLFEQGKLPGTNNGSPTYIVKNKEELVDIINCIINGKIEIDKYGFVQTEKGNYQIQADDLKLDHYLKWAEFMSGQGRQEKDVFNYIYNTQGLDKAYKYLEDISDELDNRWLVDRTLKDEEYAKNHKFLASASSILTGSLEGIGAACYSLNYLIRDEKIRKTNVYSSSDVYRQAISADIAEDSEALAFAYSTMMSMADSASLIAITAATGGTTAPILSGALMGSRAYVSTLNDSLDRGLPDWKAVLLASSAGITESLMESYSVSHLLNLEGKASPEIVKIANKISDKIPNETLASIATKTFYGGAMTMSQALVEGEEELSTDLVNYFFDEITSGELSNHNIAIDNYIKQGYSEDVARQMANKDFAKQLEQTFLGGFVSGIGFGGFGSIKVNHRISNQISSDILNDFYSNLNLNEAQKFARQLKINQLEQEKEQQKLKELKRAKRQETIDRIRNIFSNIDNNSGKTFTNVNSTESLNTGVPIPLSQLTDIKKAAHDFAEGNEKLEKLLLECFNSKIETKASCAGHEDGRGPYLAFVDNQKNMALIPSIVASLDNQNFNIVYQNATATNGNEGYIGYGGDDVRNANVFFDSISKGIQTKMTEDIPKIVGNYIGLINTIKNNSNFEHAQIVFNKDGDEYYIEASIKTLEKYKNIFTKNGFKVTKDGLLALEGNNNFINTSLINLLTDLGGVSTYDFSNQLDLSDFKYQDNNLITGFVNTLKSGVKRFIYTNTNNIEEVNKSILENGLYHFTSETSANKIIESGYVKKANVMNSYGTPKSFFFNGVPSVGAYLTNLDSLPIRTTAVKLNVDEQLVNSNKLKIRNLDDKAITYEGNLNISDYNPEKKYFCLVKMGNELVYKEVDKNTYDNYPNTIEGKKLQKFTKKIGNLKAIYNDYLYDLAANNKFLNKNVKEINRNSVSELSSFTNMEIKNDNTENIINNLAIKESTKIDNLIAEYNNTNNIKLIKDILVLHENNRSGYRNPTDISLVNKYFSADRINEVLNKAIENCNSESELQYLKDILEDENRKFDATYEITFRANEIDIDIDSLIKKIDNKLNKTNDIEATKDMVFNFYDEDLDATFVKIASIGSLLDIIKNEDLYEALQNGKAIDGGYKINYLEAFMQLYDAIKKYNYDLDLNSIQLQRLESLYNEALEKLDFSKVRYKDNLSDGLKLKIMFKTNKIYNVEDLSILYNYYQEHFNQEILSNNPSLILSDEFKFYLIEVRDFIRQNAEDVYDDSPGLLEHKYIDFFQQIKNMNTKYTDIIIKNKIDVGKEGFNDIIHQKYNWDQNDREFVDSFINKYNIDVPIVYAEDMPNSLKLKLMLRDNKIYDKNLIIEEMNKIITEENLNDPNFIFNDLFMLYYLKVSKNFTNEESSNHLSYADCSKIFLDDLTQIVTQNIDISEENFKKLLAYANMKNPSVIKYINNYFTNHQNISLDNIDYNEVFPETIKEKMIQQVLENYDLFIKNNSSQIYGADQNITSFYMTMGVKNLDWLTDENDFISYLIKKREYSVNTAKQFLSKIKSKNSNFNLDVVREGTIIIEYLYDKCNRDNSFDILDVIEQSFTFDYNNEIMRLERKLVSQGMSYFEAIRTLMAINSSGTCSYAAIANSIFLAYKDNPRAFKKDFGYLMYRNIDGHKEFNYTELILDMYVYINSNKYLNGSKKGNLFVYDETGKLHVDNLITNNQIYLSGLGWQDNTIIEAFLKSKNIKLNYKRNLIKTFDPKQEVLTKNNVNEFKKTIINYLKKDENNGIVLSIISEKKELFKISKPIRLMSSIDEVYTTTTTWEEGDGHAVFITGILDDYLVVSSWGKRLLIPIKDLIGKRFSLYFNVVEGIE